MFSFFKKKPATPEPADAAPVADSPAHTAPPAPVVNADADTAPQETGWLNRLRRSFGADAAAATPAPHAEAAPETALPLAEQALLHALQQHPADSTEADTLDEALLEQAALAAAPEEAMPAALAAAPATPDAAEPAATEAAAATTGRTSWFNRLKTGLRKTGNSLTTVFTGTRIDDELYEDLEAALLMADTGVSATQYLLDDLKTRVKTAKATAPAQVKALLIDAITDLLAPLQKQLVIGEHTPTVIMVAGVNGAGKTTSIGKLTKHLSHHGQSVLLAAGDTFRAAAREQLAVWADRNTVEIVSNAGGDPAALAFDAVAAGRAREKNVVLVDTAGRLPTQLHLMDELKKIRRTINKAYVTAPHEVLLVIDGNTGQNALAQVKAFDEALRLTGLIVTKLDGTAKGGVLCAIARWGQERTRTSGSAGPVPVYFIGVGEKLEDLETFDAREFAQALLT